MTGPIPPELAQLPNLARSGLSSNQLINGRDPQELAQRDQPVEAWIWSSNQLTLDIRPSWRQGQT